MSKRARMDGRFRFLLCVQSADSESSAQCSSDAPARCLAHARRKHAGKCEKTATSSLLAFGTGGQVASPSPLDEFCELSTM